MNLTPLYIKENIDEIGYKAGITLLKDWINNSSDSILRRTALKVFGHLENGKNFKFFEQLFLTDEDLEIRLISGKLLKDGYYNHRKLTSLLEFTLSSEQNFEQKILAIEILNSLKSKKSNKIIKDFLKKSIKEHFSDKIREFPEEIFDDDYSLSLPKSVLEICLNLILFIFYRQNCGYNVTLRKGIIILLSCEGAYLKEISEIPAFYRLTRLEYLILQKNRINKIKNLEHLKYLKFLDLRDNQIKEIENIELIQNLEELNLSFNQIKRIENLKLQRLKKLSLDHNSITKIRNLDFLVNLEFLNLSHNYLERIENLEKLHNLKNLNLSGNNIEKISGLENLVKLITLRLNDNKITRIGGLENLRILKILNLSNNVIECIENLNNLQNLTKLELSKNKITKMEGFDQLIKLQELFLDKNQITKLEGLDNLESLIILFLEKNFISEYRLSFTEHLRNLNFIFLNENPLTPESRKNYTKKTRFP